jgi:uncharacterized protein (TIGR00369 family)
MTPKLPPYAAFLGLRADGDLLVMPFASSLIGAPGRLHGGAIAGLLEIAALRAVLARLPEGATAKPISVTVDYLREGRMIDSFARAHVLRLGRRVANVRADLFQDDPDRLVASARLNILLRQPA